MDRNQDLFQQFASTAQQQLNINNPNDNTQLFNNFINQQQYGSINLLQQQQQIQQQLHHLQQQQLLQQQFALAAVPSTAQPTFLMNPPPPAIARATVINSSPISAIAALSANSDSNTTYRTARAC